jgi:transcriptional regulator with GAF, ATPase, and Fis domain
MMNRLRLAGVLPELDAEVYGIAAVDGFGMVLPDGDDRVLLLSRSAWGNNAYTFTPADLPAPLRLQPSRAEQFIPFLQYLDPARTVDAMFARSRLERLTVAPLSSGPGLFYTATRTTDPLTDAQVQAYVAVGDQIVRRASAPESLDDSLRRLRRLEVLDSLLPALADALDVRDIFSRLASIVSQVLPHDALNILIPTADRQRGTFYARAGDETLLPEIIDLPPNLVLTDAWRYFIIDDLQAHPEESTLASAKAGFRASLRVPIRLRDRFFGALNVMSFEPRRYRGDDLFVASRMAEHLALALSHAQLAEESRRSAALRERAAHLDMLDALLLTLTGVLDIREVFGRVSEIARAVLPHDAMAIAFVLENPPRLRVHALSGFDDIGGSFEAPMPEPALITEPWDYRIMDLPDEPLYARSPTVAAGMGSVLCLPVRFEGRLHAGVNFYCRAKRGFTRDDVLIGRRIADHIALTLSHQRLAEEARRSEELRAMTANLELLDELLVPLTDTGDLRQAFDRISAIARKVLAHDALTLPVLQPNGRTARVFASSGIGPGVFPDEVELPPAFSEADWEYDLVDDMPALPDQRNLRAAKAGYRSALRVPIRLDGKVVAALAFLSFAPSVYKQADVRVARRMADRFALCLSRERRTEASERADEATARAALLESRVRELTEELDARTGYRRVVGDSLPWRQVLTQATQVAATETTVLLLGESGTGKEVIARFLHRASPRARGPFVALNCAALPEQLLEAELFGYERGAFTGATQSKPGQLEQAAGGTLFLDEVAEMNPASQAKFLRVLQEREFQRLGGTRVLKTDARVIAATNRDLHLAMERGQFREDLYYRLNVFAIHLPPLRDRRDDILALSEAFLAEYGRTLGRPPAGISRDARKQLLEYQWPGNVRELRNSLERAAILCDGGLITADHLPLSRALTPTPSSTSAAAAPVPVPAPVPQEAQASASSAADLHSMERAMVVKALENAKFNKSKAAKELGLTRSQLYVRMKRYGLE